MSSGTRVGGRYRLLDPIGRGGMGEVWRAEDERLGRPVAVKCVLRPAGGGADDAVLRARFAREARVAASLQHRGITTVHDYGEDAGLLFLVMELLDGENLARLLADAHPAPLPLADTVDAAVQIADALAYTHARGVVHRDLKPANIVRVADGTVKICDFGIARISRRTGARLTGNGTALGTPHYMSPEQIAGQELDHRSDLYSFGCVLYEMLTGRPPFDLDDPWAVMLHHRDIPPQAPGERRAGVPADLQALVLELLAKQPRDRPDDAAGPGRRLARIAAGLADRHDGPDQEADPPSAPPGATRTAPADPVRGGTGEPASGTSAPDPARDGGSGSPAPPRPAPHRDTGDVAAARLARRHRYGLELASGGRWEKAAAVLGRVADDRARALGPEHRDTLASRYEQGYALGRARRWPESLQVYRRVADARERTCGPEHPDTLRARQEIGFTLGRLGRYADAHRVYTGVLRHREETAGPDDPDTLRCRHNMGVNLGRMGRPGAALAISVEVAQARSRVLGPYDPETLATRFETGIGLGRTGRWGESLREHRAVATARSRVLGAEHADTLASHFEVAFALGRLGRAAEALEITRRLAAARTRTLGARHPDTLRARHAAGINLGRLGRWQEALAEAEQVAALRAAVLGPHHPDTLVSRREIAVGLGWLDRWSEALEHYRAIAEERERTLGGGDPYTVAARNDQARCLDRLGRGSEAAALRRTAAAAGRGLTGERPRR